MAYIKNNEENRVGNWVTTEIVHSSCSGTFEIGSKVKIIGISERGYDIMDEYGNKMLEIGWVI